MTNKAILKGNGMAVRLELLFEQQENERGLTPMPLESDALLRRVQQGDWSGKYLADAFISTYRIGQPFEWSLGEIINLDAEGFRLFHEILHMRHVSGWSDEWLYGIEREIKRIKEAQHEAR